MLNFSHHFVYEVWKEKKLRVDIIRLDPDPANLHPDPQTSTHTYAHTHTHTQTYARTQTYAQPGLFYERSGIFCTVNLGLINGSWPCLVIKQILFLNGYFCNVLQDQNSSGSTFFQNKDVIQ